MLSMRKPVPDHLLLTRRDRSVLEREAELRRRRADDFIPFKLINPDSETLMRLEADIERRKRGLPAVSRFVFYFLFLFFIFSPNQIKQLIFIFFPSPLRSAVPKEDPESSGVRPTRLASIRARRTESGRVLDLDSGDGGSPVAARQMSSRESSRCVEYFYPPPPHPLKCIVDKHAF
jgi:hypothetical protein